MPLNASWGWRKLLRVRDKPKELLTWKICDGYTTSLWYDNRHPDDAPPEWLGEKEYTIRDGLRRLECALQSREICGLGPNSKFEMLKHGIPGSLRPRPAVGDVLVWKDPFKFFYI